MSKITENKKKTLNVPKNLTKTQQSNKLSEDMENEIKDAFNFYDVDKKGLIARNNLRSILGMLFLLMIGNFAFSKMNGKEIQEQISYIYDNKDQFTLQETIQIITKKWFEGKGREAQAEQMFALFDRKEKGGVGLSEIKHVFNQYLDINISDADILQFIEEADNDKKGYLNKEEFFMKLGYN